MENQNISSITRITKSGDEDHNANTCTTPRHKVAVILAYCGAGYQGMQKNPGAKTIEAELQEALYFSGAVPENERGFPKRFDFSRCARTDKGVSAVGQVVSGNFYVDPPGFVDRLNSKLPDQFHVFGYKRVTSLFSAKKLCDRRRYVYLLPVFALDPASHRDRESVLASLGSENELVKCSECSERGRKVFTAMAVHSSEVEIQSGISSNTLSALSEYDGKQENLTPVDNRNCCKVSLNSEHVIFEDKSLANPSDLGNGCDNNSNSDAVKENVFSYGNKERQRFNKILKQYEGTHNFHNFTTRTKATDPSASRCIISFHANTTVIVDGIEFVKCEVVGQSFMLHQIRKMVGVAVTIMRNCAPESLIEMALQRDAKINMPTAPEVGLYLDECFFSSYNQKWKHTHEEVSMKAYTEEAEEFKLKHIYSHIASTEHKEGAIAIWLHSLNYRNYPDLRFKENSGANEVSGAETTRIHMDSLNYQHYPPLGPENNGSYELAGTKTKETTRCNRVALNYQSHISPRCFHGRPLHYYEKPTVHEIDLEHLATTMKNRLNLVLPFIQELRVRYSVGTENDITSAIVSDVNMMVDTAMSVTYNRLRFILHNYEPTVFVAQMNPRSPLSNKYKFPAFISFVLGSIGPLRIMDGHQDMLVIYATSANRSQTYGRSQHFEFKCDQFFRLIDNLTAIGVPLAPIDVRGGNRDGSFFPTIIPNRENGLWEFIATCHCFNYMHRDILSAWLTLNDDPALRAFPDCSLTIDCCTDPDFANDVIALRPEGVSDDLDGATAPARLVGGAFSMNVFGVKPALAAEGGNPLGPAMVYSLERGTARYCCASLCRDISEHEMTSMLREYILRYDSSWINACF
ncbi:hypothetical protein R6Q59_006960 [Mikania micrantha]